VKILPSEESSGYLTTLTCRTSSLPQIQPSPTTTYTGVPDRLATSSIPCLSSNILYPECLAPRPSNRPVMPTLHLPFSISAAFLDPSHSLSGCPFSSPFLLRPYLKNGSPIQILSPAQLLLASLFSTIVHIALIIHLLLPRKSCSLPVQIPSSLQYYQFAFVPPSTEFNTWTSPQTQTPEQMNKASSICALAFHSFTRMPCSSHVTARHPQVLDDVHVDPRARSGYGDGDPNAMERNDSLFQDVNLDRSPTSRSVTALLLLILPMQTTLVLGSPVQSGFLAQNSGTETETSLPAS